MEDHPLFYLGIVCVIAAVVGGGLKAFGTELPIIGSVARQFLLATIGAGLIYLFAPWYFWTALGLEPHPMDMDYGDPDAHLFPNQ
jgi:hypothetical protein